MPEYSRKSALLCAALLLAMVHDAHASDYHSESRAAAPTRDDGTYGGAAAIDVGEGVESNEGVAELIEQTPGVDIRRSGGPGDPAYLSVRGAEAWQNRVTFDGIPLDGAEGGSFDLSLLPPELLGGLEVYRGQVPLTLAAPGPGGLLAFSSPALQASGGPVTGSAALTIGSFDTRSVYGGARFELERSAGIFAASYRGSSGDYPYFSDNGTRFNPDDDEERRRQNNASNRYAVLESHQWRVARWKLRLLSLAAGQSRGVPGIGVADATQTRRDEHRGLVGFRASRPALLRRLDLDLLGSVGVRWSRYQDPAGELSLRETDLRELATSTFVAARPSVFLPANLRLDLSLEARVESWHPRERDAGESFGRALRTTLSSAAELSGEHAGGWFRWRAGARVDGLFDATEVDRVEGARRALVSPQAGVVLAPPLGEDSGLRLELSAAVGIAHRAPSFFELYGNRGMTIGNPELRSERRTGYESGAALRWERERAEAGLSYSFYDRRVDDLIVFVLNSQGVAIPENVSRAALRGHELAVDVRYAGWVDFRASYALLDALNRSEGDLRFNQRLPFRPEHRYAARLFVGPRSLQAGYRLHGASSFFLDAREREAVPARIEQDLILRFGDASGAFSITLEVNNLLDARSDEVMIPDGGQLIATERALADFVGQPIPGRSFYATIAWSP